MDKFKFTILLIAIVSNLSAQNIENIFSADTSYISHGPTLGDVSEHAVRIWVRTNVPADVSCDLFKLGSKRGQRTQKIRTQLASDNTCIIKFDKLKKETEYKYVVRVGKSEYQASFTTLGPSLTQKRIITVNCILKKQ